MYTVCVRDHFMIAHSFRGEAFGPAQSMHGATYVVDLELRRPDLDPDGVVVDIGKLSDCLRAVLGELNYRNLNEAAASSPDGTPPPSFWRGRSSTASPCGSRMGKWGRTPPV